MVPENPFRLIHELKGAPLAILITLSLVRQPVTKEWLERTTGYTDKPVSQALAYLTENGLALGTQTGWQLTESARELPLFHTPQAVPETSRNFSDSLEGEVNSLNIDKRELTSPSVVDSDFAMWKKDSDPPLNPVKILMAARDLFGEPIMIEPDQYPPGRLLAWIAQAYESRHNGVRKPARLVYKRLKRGDIPDRIFREYPLSYLPDEFLEIAGFGYMLVEEEEEEIPIDPEFADLFEDKTKTDDNADSDESSDDEDGHGDPEG
jgi:hypothetical protein